MLSSGLYSAQATIKQPPCLPSRATKQSVKQPLNQPVNVQSDLPSPNLWIPKLTYRPTSTYYQPTTNRPTNLPTNHPTSSVADQRSCRTTNQFNSRGTNRPIHSLVAQPNEPNCGVCDLPNYVRLDWVGKHAINIVWKPTNAIITHGHNPTHENSGKQMVTRNKHYMKTNERHNPSPQPNPRKFRKENG